MTVTKKLDKTLRVLTILLGIATVLAMSHVYALLYPAQAVALSSVSDLLSTSAPSTAANHTITWSMPTTSGTFDNDATEDSIRIDFDAEGTQDFTFGTIGADDIDFAIQDEGAGGFVDESTAAGDDTCAGAVDVEIEIIADTSITFHMCGNDDGVSVDPDDDVEIQIGAHASGSSGDQITNPATAGTSYDIGINADEDDDGTIEDEGETRVMILDQVTTSAMVNTTLNCTVTGLADGSTLTFDGGAGDFTTDSNSGGSDQGTAGAASLDFDFITPDDGSSDEGATDLESLAQELTVATNASNGFLWTLEQDQNIQSAIGADFDLFIDSLATSTPTNYVSPSIDINSEDTWGHYGIITDDSDLEDGTDGTGSADDDFNESTQAGCTYGGSEDWCVAGNIATARPIFAHGGPADGDAMTPTQDAGLARWALLIEATSLQEAATDYTNTLTHICTPTF